MAVAVPSRAQQITVGTPYRNLQSSFFENNSINWSGNYRGITFSFGGGVLARPPFGSPDNSAGLTANFGFAGKDGQINFATNFSQGARQSSVTQTPSVTFMNGQTGYVSNESLTPFVMGAIPVVGGFPVAPQQMQPLSGMDPVGVDPQVQAMLQAHADAQAQAADQAAAQAGGPVPPPPQPGPNAMAPQQDRKAGNVPDPIPAPSDPGEAAALRLNAAQESTAGRPALSVLEARRLHQQEQAVADGEMAALMVRARALEEDGKPNVAKIYYQRIAKHASGELQQQARTRLYELQGSSKP
jgi:hypothetical protein